jgi:hypothetical protein
MISEWVNGARAAALLESQLAISLTEAIRIVNDAILAGTLHARRAGKDEPPLAKQQWQAEARKQKDKQISLRDCEITRANLYGLAERLKPAKPPTGAKRGPKASWDWDGWWAYMCGIVHKKKGLRSARAEMIERGKQWFIDHYGDHPGEVGDTEIRRRVAMLYKELDAN